MKKRTMAFVATGLLLPVALIVIALNSDAMHQWLHPTPKDTIAVHYLQDNPQNFRAIDSTLGLLHNGDLVLRAGNDATSYMLRQMNLTNNTYSHCGIVMIENGYPFVYHSIGGEDNPDEHLRRDSAALFFSPATNARLGVARLDLSPAAIGRLHRIVQRYYAAKIRFDLDFDLATDDKLYCAEFAYKAIREATADTAYFGVTRLGKRTYVGVDNLFENPHARIICDYQFN